MGPCAAWFYEGQLRPHRNWNYNNGRTEIFSISTDPKDNKTHKNVRRQSPLLQGIFKQMSHSQKDSHTT